ERYSLGLLGAAGTSTTAGVGAGEVECKVWQPPSNVRAASNSKDLFMGGKYDLLAVPASCHKPFGKPMGPDSVYRTVWSYC
ncbi:MAG: hypothetical protein CFE49_17765, partial [Pseudomonas sp. PGPPP3]